LTPRGTGVTSRVGEHSLRKKLGEKTKKEASQKVSNPGKNKRFKAGNIAKGLSVRTKFFERMGGRTHYKRGRGTYFNIGETARGKRVLANDFKDHRHRDLFLGGGVNSRPSWGRREKKLSTLPK